jgi:hypothetical protein
MDVASIAKLSSSVAETGIKQEVGLAVLKRAQEIQASTASQLINAVQAPPSVQNLPANLGNTINTTA